MKIFSVCLTERQQQIGFCLLQGMSVKAIARQCNISIRAVRAHQSLIRKKLLCQNNYQVGYRLGIFLKKESKIFVEIPDLEVTHVTFDSDQ